MNKFVQEPPRRSVHNGTKKDTGFPEPLSPDRNTTLPHPDADTSANASIEEPDISLTRTHSRRSFLSRHQSHKAPKHTHKDSGISVSGAGLYDSEKDTTSSPRAIESRVVGGATSLALEKELGSVHRSSESSEDDVVLLKDETDAQGYREGQRRKGVLRKLHLHKI